MDQEKISLLRQILYFLSTNRASLLILVLIVMQFLTWQATLDVKNEVNDVYRAIYRNACGGSATFDKPCRVVISQ